MFGIQVEDNEMEQSRVLGSRAEQSDAEDNETERSEVLGSRAARRILKWSRAECLETGQRIMKRS